MTRLHCAREDCGWQTRRYGVKDGHIHCNDFICFFYFTDVNPGDGGVVVLPGSHKSEFERPQKSTIPVSWFPNPHPMYRQF
jgi:ectoine hydroxylase-related dioxygenase (phytanoyl-CoA dioxygenase family)